MTVDYTFIEHLLKKAQDYDGYLVEVATLFQDMRTEYETLDISDFPKKFVGHLLLLHDVGAIETPNGNRTLGIRHNEHGAPVIGGDYIRLTLLGQDMKTLLQKPGTKEKLKNLGLRATAMLAQEMARTAAIALASKLVL